MDYLGRSILFKCTTFAIKKINHLTNNPCIMKTILSALGLSLLVFTSCGGQKKAEVDFIQDNIDNAVAQNTIQTDIIEKSGKILNPRTINKDGSISGAKVVRSIDPDLDKEALRVINSMPQWKPGMNKGEIVSVKYTIPVMFRLQ